MKPIKIFLSALIIIFGVYLAINFKNILLALITTGLFFLYIAHFHFILLMVKFRPGSGKRVIYRSSAIFEQKVKKMNQKKIKVNKSLTRKKSVIAGAVASNDIPENHLYARIISAIVEENTGYIKRIIEYF
jgi:hypothetical protein